MALFIRRVRTVLRRSQPIGVPSRAEAALLLESAGQRLQSATIQGSVVAVADSDVLADDLLRLIYYLECYGPAERFTFLEFLWLGIRNLSFVVPGYGSELIRTAEYVPIDSHDDVGTTSLLQFARQVELKAHHIAAIDYGGQDDEEEGAADAMSELLGVIPELPDWEDCPGHPTDVARQVVRLQVLMGPSLPEGVTRSFTSYLVMVASVVAGLFTIPWVSLADRTAFTGIGQICLPLGMFLIGNAAGCAIIAFDVRNALNEESVATAKTLSKATTIILALATVFLGAGLTVPRQSAGLIIAGVLIYAAILLSTLSADSLVNRSEARLKILALKK